jgi:hypothetical protein
VQAILRRPETATDAYVSMVEERSASALVTERGKWVAAKATGVLATAKSGLLQLFSSAVPSGLKYAACSGCITPPKTWLNFASAIPSG